MESFNQVHIIISSCVPSWGRVQWCCCCCWSALRGWWGLWLHPLQRPLPPSRELPLSLSLSPVGGQEAQTTPFIWQNDNHWQWGLSYLTQGRLQRHFFSPAASCWTNTPVQLQREANKVRKCERAVWVLNGTSRTETSKSSGSLAFSHNAQKAQTAVCQRRDRHQQTNDIKKKCWTCTS